MATSPVHCSNCGSYIASGTHFCASCGSVAADPEITQLSGSGGAAYQLKAEDRRGEPIFTTRPTMLFIKTGYLAAIVGGIALTAFLASFASLRISAIVSIAVALSLLLIPAYYHLRRNTIRYTLTGTEVEIDSGLIARTTRNIPLRAIQDVTVKATILQRLFRYGDVIIDNADSTRGNVVLRNIHDPRHYADLLLRELRKRG